MIYKVRVDDVPGIGIDHKSGEVTLIGTCDDGDEYHFTFSSEQIPHLGVDLASAFAALATATSAAEPQTSLRIESAEILGTAPNLTFLATLSTGLPVAFSLPLDSARAMLEYLKEALP